MKRAALVLATLLPMALAAQDKDPGSAANQSGTTAAVQARCPYLPTKLPLLAPR